MKRDLKNKKFVIFISIVLFNILILNFVPGVSSSSGTGCNFEVTLLNQDPYPAIPGEYVNIVFQVGGVQNSNCKGAIFELIPTYPFSLDENNSVSILSGTTGSAGYKNDWMIPYKLRVDKDAVNGDNELKVKFGIRSSNFFITKNFNITVQDSRTAFDAVIQESSSTDVSIAIANTGKYAANSVVVRIPEQEDFRATGTDGQMIGNLDSGDYTIVSFSISAIPNRNYQQVNNTRSNFNQESNLKFDIYYTDALGERRTVNMELPLNSNAATGNFSMNGIPTNGNFPGRTRNQSSWSNWYTFAIILIIIIVAFFFYRKYKKKIIMFIKKNRLKTHSKSDKTPDWIKNIIDKEKK